MTEPCICPSCGTVHRQRRYIDCECGATMYTGPTGEQHWRPGRDDKATMLESVLAEWRSERAEDAPKIAAPDKYPGRPHIPRAAYLEEIGEEPRR